MGMLLALILAAGGSPAHAASEYAVKAAFLYKFAAFVEWPSTAFASPASPLNLCIVGYDPFGSALDKAIEGQRLAEHPIVAKRLERAHPDADCHIAYVAGSKAQPVAEGLSELKNAPVLTVTDEAMGSSRGAVHFVVKDSRVRFHIDNAAAEQNRLIISSKLLRLALSVRLRKGARA